LFTLRKYILKRDSDRVRHREKESFMLKDGKRERE